MRLRFALCLSSALLSGAGSAQHHTPPSNGGPVIDMHLHASYVDEYGPPPLGMCTPTPPVTWDQRTPYPEAFLHVFQKPSCADPVWSPKAEDELLERTIASMKRAHVVLGVLSGPPELVAKWKKAAPDMFLSGIGLRLGRHYPVEQVEELRKTGALDVLAEVTTEYEGVSPDDERLEPYWAFAEKNDIPVGIHVGPGPYGSVYLGDSKMRVRLSSAWTMEEVLNRHPKMRVYLQHAGYPLIDDMIGLMYMYPQVYVDTGVIIYTAPREEFYQYVRRLTKAGFGKRILFGTDQMVWPETIERSVKIIQDAPFLTAEQKRDILYNNAVRFLRLSR